MLEVSDVELWEETHDLEEVEVVKIEAPCPDAYARLVQYMRKVVRNIYRALRSLRLGRAGAAGG